MTGEPTTAAGRAYVDWFHGGDGDTWLGDELVLAIEAEARAAALADVTAAVRRMNGNGFDEPSEPALEAVLAAIKELENR